MGADVLESPIKTAIGGQPNQETFVVRIKKELFENAENLAAYTSNFGFWGTLCHGIKWCKDLTEKVPSIDDCSYYPEGSDSPLDYFHPLSADFTPSELNQLVQELGQARAIESYAFLGLGQALIQSLNSSGFSQKEWEKRGELFLGHLQEKWKESNISPQAQRALLRLVIQHGHSARFRFIGALQTAPFSQVITDYPLVASDQDEKVEITYLADGQISLLLKAPIKVPGSSQVGEAQFKLGIDSMGVVHFEDDVVIEYTAEKEILNKIKGSMLNYVATPLNSVVVGNECVFSSIKEEGEIIHALLLAFNTMMTNPSRTTSNPVADQILAIVKNEKYLLNLQNKISEKKNKGAPLAVYEKAFYDCYGLALDCLDEVYAIQRKRPRQTTKFILEPYHEYKGSSENDSRFEPAALSNLVKGLDGIFKKKIAETLSEHAPKIAESQKTIANKPFNYVKTKFNRKLVAKITAVGALAGLGVGLVVLFAAPHVALFAVGITLVAKAVALAHLPIGVAKVATIAGVLLSGIFSGAAHGAMLGTLVATATKLIASVRAVIRGKQKFDGARAEEQRHSGGTGLGLQPREVLTLRETSKDDSRVDEQASVASGKSSSVGQFKIG